MFSTWRLIRNGRGIIKPQGLNKNPMTNIKSSNIQSIPKRIVRYNSYDLTAKTTKEYFYNDVKNFIGEYTPIGIAIVCCNEVYQELNEKDKTLENKILKSISLLTILLPLSTMTFITVDIGVSFLSIYVTKNILEMKLFRTFVCSSVVERFKHDFRKERNNNVLI